MRNVITWAPLISQVIVLTAITAVAEVAHQTPS
jgi:hypothetical protein